MSALAGLGARAGVTGGMKDCLSCCGQEGKMELDPVMGWKPGRGTWVWRETPGTQKVGSWEAGGGKAGR